MLRKILSIVAGIAVAIATILAVEWLDTTLFPIPDSVATDDPAQLAAMVAAMPFGAKLLVVSGWLFGSLLGALVAFRVARSDATGWVIAALVAAGGIGNVLTIPHPLWMALCAAFLPFVGAMFAFGLYRRSVARAGTLD